MSTRSTFVSDDLFSIPLDISDLLSICKQYNQLGLHIQYQLDLILEIGVAEAMKNNSIKNEAMPHIKAFLKAIIDNPYFGEARDIATEHLMALEQHQKRSNYHLFN